MCRSIESFIAKSAAVFILVFVSLPVFSAELASGSYITGTSEAGVTNSYTFSAVQGQEFRIHVAKLSGESFSPVLSVYAPDGSRILNSENNRRSPASQTGVYRIEVFDNKTNSAFAVAGEYKLGFVIGAGSVSHGELQSGSNSFGTSLGVAEIRSFNFTAMAGQAARIQVGKVSTNNFKPVLDVYDPSGGIVVSASKAIDFKATESGVYTVALFDNRGFKSNSLSGDYNLSFVLALANVSNGKFSGAREVAGSLDVAEIDSYTFDAVVGQNIGFYLEKISGAELFSPKFLLYDPQGVRKVIGATSDTITISETGKYTLAVIDKNVDTLPGKYSLIFLPPGYSLSSAYAGIAGSNLTKEACTGCPGDLSEEERKKLKGNPINIAQGFKAQFETDYSNGALNFTRTYRSDSAWTDSDVGAFWRHNFNRKINFYVDATVRHAEVINNRGVISSFKLVSDNWESLDPDFKATFKRMTDAEGLFIGYLYSLPNNTSELFDENGLLKRIEYQGSQTLDYTYDTSSRLSTVTDESGRQLVFAYDNVDRIIKLSTPDGDFSYSYDENNNLISVTHPNATSRTYHYENASFINALTGITDERNIRFSTWEYNAQGRATLSEHADGVDKITVSYNDDETSTVTNVFGKQSIYTFETIQGVRKIVKVKNVASDKSPETVETYSYTTEGRIDTKTNAGGNVTSFIYNDRGLVTSRTDAKGSAEERTITTTWVDTFNLPDVITEPGRTIDYEYDEFGRVISVTATDTATLENRVSASTYYPNTTNSFGDIVLGRLETVDGPRTDVSDVVRYEYDANFNINKITNALGQVVNITSFDAAGRVLSMSDVNGVVTSMTYDTLGRLLSQARGDRISSYEYDAAGLLVKAISADGRTSSFTYDDVRRLVKTESTTGETLEYVLDKAGNQLEVILKDAAANVTNQSKQEFDELSRLLASIETINDTEARTEFSYDLNGNLKTIKDPNENVTTNAYDALQRLTELTDAKSGVMSSLFNSLNQVTSVNAPNGAQTTFSYNALGDVTQEVSPDRGTTDYTYDSGGNLATKTDARGITTTLTYDVLNRLLSVSYPDASENISYVYDASPNETIACDNGTGRLCQVTDESGVTHFSYDIYGNLTKRVHAELEIDYTNTFSYNKASNLIELTTSAGKTIRNSYDQEQRISKIEADVDGEIVTIASELTYRPDGQEATINFSNGMSESRSYNKAGLLKEISSAGNPIVPENPVVTVTPVDGGDEKAEDDSGGFLGIGSMTPHLLGLVVFIGLFRIFSQASRRYLLSVIFCVTGASFVLSTPAVADLTLEYDLNKNIVSRTTDDSTSTFQYDELNRLLAEDGDKATQAFTYDANGNRLSDGDGIYGFDVSSNVMSSKYGNDIVYDAAGNMLDNGHGLIFTYNNAGRLKTVKREGAILATYTYNTFGQRTRKVTPKGTTIYHYDLAGQLLEETLTDGTPITTYVWRNNKPTAVIYEPETTSNSSATEEKLVYLHVDHLNTPRTATNETQTLVWSWESDAFGSTDANEDVDGDAELVKMNLRFPGQYLDEETGLYYNWNRYYDSTSGRYIQSDPIGVFGDLNSFQYALSNSISNIDVRGLKTLHNNYGAKGNDVHLGNETVRLYNGIPQVTVLGGHGVPSSGRNNSTGSIAGMSPSGIANLIYAEIQSKNSKGEVAQFLFFSCNAGLVINGRSLVGDVLKEIEKLDRDKKRNSSGGMSSAIIYSANGFVIPTKSGSGHIIRMPQNIFATKLEPNMSAKGKWISAAYGAVPENFPKIDIPLLEELD